MICACCQIDKSSIEPTENPPIFSKGLNRRKFTLACLSGGLLANVGNLIKPAEATQTAYGNGTDGPLLDINGSKLPRDTVFRFLPVLIPLSTFHVTSLYGMRNDPIHGYSQLHPGVDFRGAIGTPIFSTAGGRVMVAEERGDGYGKRVDIQHALGFMTRYAHLSAFNVVKGQIVDRETQIGLVGDTGYITGPHLHFEIRKDNTTMDPIMFLLRANDIYRHLK